MHPARSIVLFTTASGAGYGLLALLGLLGPTGLLPQERGFGAEHDRRSRRGRA